MYSNFHLQWRKPHSSLMKFIKRLQTLSSTSYLKNNENQNIVNVIKYNTEITNCHLTPEIKLRLITSDISNRRTLFQYENYSNEDPFWGYYWPGGQVLSRLSMILFLRCYEKSITLKIIFSDTFWITPNFLKIEVLLI